MEMRDELNIDGRTYNFIKGLRNSNISVKIYKSDQDYIVLEKRYFLGFTVKKKIRHYNNYFDAEDEIIHLREEKTPGFK